MITKLAQGEIDRLEGDGIRLTPEEIVTLNDFAIEALNHKNYYQSVYAERRVRWGGFTLREPTFAHIHFIEQISDVVDFDNLQTSIVARSWVCSMSVDELPDPNDTNAVLGKLLQWRATIQYITPAVLEAILIYVWLGPNHLPRVVGNKTKEEDPISDALRDWSLETVINGVALCVGLTMEDAMRMRPCELDSMVVQRLRAKDGVEQKDVFGKFYAYLDEVEEKHRKQNEVKR